MAAPKTISSMTNRQKITIIAFVLVVLVLAWLIYGTFKSETAPPPIEPQAVGAPPAGGTAAISPATVGPQGGAPQPAQLAKQPPPLTPREAQLMQMQQETEVKYLDALNQLQMLRIEQQIQETSKAIASAKLDTITAQKSIINLLAPPIQETPAAYAQGLVSPTSATRPGGTTQQPTTLRPSTTEVSYSVISVSFLRSQWNAVLGYQGNLYSVQVGDVLPADGSRVISIDNSGLVLEKDGTRRKLSMVPII